MGIKPKPKAMKGSQNIGCRYVEGLMTPDLYLRRGLQYTFKIEGGNNAASAEFYHPFIITDEPVGGYNRLTKEQKSKVFVVVMIIQRIV